MSKALVALFNKLGACDEATEWVKDQPSRRAAWENCKRSDWMLWIIDRSVVDRDDPRLRLMACDFAGAVLHLVPVGENRPAEAIRVARLFASGGATHDDLAAAGDAARDAAWAAAWDAAGAAAWAAARAAARAAAGAAAGAAARAAARAAAGAAAGAAARAAAWAAAGDAAWDAAGAAARAAAGDAAGAAQCHIIRSYFPTCPKIKEKKP